MRFTDTVRGCARAGLRDKARLIAAWFLLGLSGLAIAVLPFRLVRSLLGENRSTALDAPPVELDPVQRARAAHIGTIVQVAAQQVPWRSDCYPQALTAKAFLVLRRIPHVVSFGVRRDGDALVAHAWVHAGDVAVTGGTGSDYTEVGAFSWSPRRNR